MHPALLERYFDVEAWHRDLFLALLEYKTPWTWQDLSDAFMQVCCHLHSPKGSASKRPDFINHFHRIEWARIECAKGEEDAAKIIVHAYTPALPRHKPRCRRALLKAVRWSMEHHKLETQWRDAISKALEEAEQYVDQPDWEAKKLHKLNCRVGNLRDTRDRILKTHRKKFRLAEERSGS